MNSIGIAIALGVLGVCLGSFVNALVWRLHANRDFVRERSECVRCHHALAWYDLIPVVSWLLLAGKCRYCKKPISWQYPVVELAQAMIFVVSYYAWPFGVGSESLILLGIWLASSVILMALLVYDARWYLLPDKLTFPLIAVGVIYAIFRWSAVTPVSLGQLVFELLAGIASVAGVYGLLYVVSRGNWVGFGDVKLGVYMGLVLGWQLGLVAIFIANLVGLLVILPSMVTKRLSLNSQIPFGPFLIVGHSVALLWGAVLIASYTSYFLTPVLSAIPLVL